MREMKESGIYYLGKIPREWAVQKFKYFSKSRMGETILLEETGEEGIPIYSATQEDKIFGYTKNAKFLLSKDDIVIPARGNSIGCATLVKNEKATCTQTTIGCYDIKNINNKFYYFSILALKDEWFKYDGSAIPQITVEQVKNNKLAIPDYAEQQRIVNFLDKKVEKIDSIIQKTKETIEDYKKYKQSIITKAVTKGLNKNVNMKKTNIEWVNSIPQHWEDTRLKNKLYVRARLGWKGLKAEEYVEEGYPLLSAFNIIDSKLDFSEVNYINKFRYDESPEIKLSVNDILIVKDGAGIGKCAIVEKLPQESTVNGSIALLTCEDGLNSKYLYYYFLSKIFQKYIDRLKDGMGVPHLFQRDIKMIYLAIPPKEEQNDIAEYLDKNCNEIDNLISNKQKIIEELEQYKKSLIYEYVTGKKEVI